MPQVLPFTQAQPEQWPRKQLGELFSMVGSSLQNHPVLAQEGDIFLRFARTEGTLQAQLVDKDEELRLAGGVLLRSRGAVRPEFFLQWINLPSVQRPLINNQRHLSASGMMFSWMGLKTVEMAVPDLPTQESLLEAVAVSAGWLREHAKQAARMATTQGQLADALAGEILKGALDRRGALVMVGQAMAPQLASVKKIEEPAGISGVEAAMKENDGERFISLSEHRRIVGALQAELRAETTSDAAPASTAPRRQP